MESLALSQRRLSRNDLISGVGGSIFVHALVLSLAVAIPSLMPRKVFTPPYCTVNLVSMQDIGSGSAEKKGVPSKAPDEAKVSEAKPSVSKEPAVPVKRLRLEEPLKKQEPIKKIEPRDAPKVAEPPPNLAAIEKNLDKLIPKPKPIQTRTPVEEEPEPGPPPKASPSGSPKGSEVAGNRGTAQGSTSGSPEGSRATSAVLSYYKEKVRDSINQQWALPNVSNVSQLETRLVIVIARNGNLLQMHVEKTSGDSSFDEAAKRAVQKATLPPLPEVYTAQNIEYLVRFTPEGMS